MKNLTISVAMCVYNGASFLKDQLESIASQTHLPNELIICDDQSTDNSIIIINEFSCNSPFPVKLYKNDIQLGSTKNFEKAITLCSGDIIVLSDQDDVWLPYKLSTTYDIFNASEDVSMMFSEALIVDDKLNSMGFNLWQVMKFTGRQQKMVESGGLYTVLLKHNVVTGATMAFRGCYKDFILPIDPLWVHDAWIAFLLSTVKNTNIVNKPLVMYRQHSLNQIGARKLSVIKLIERSLKRIQDHFYYNQYELYYNAYVRFVYNNYICVSELESKVQHLKLRSSLFSKKNKILSCFVELVTLKYHRFSSGSVSFFEDLISWTIYWYFPSLLNGKVNSRFD